MLTLEQRDATLNNLISSQSKENQKKFNEEFKVILTDNQYCILYGIKNFSNQPYEQVISAKEKLYKEMFEEKVEN